MNIKQTLGIFALAILMSSCATIINDPYKEITVYTTKPSKVIYNGYTIETVDNKADFLVERKNEPINFTATTDSLIKTFQVKPQNSFMYWSNLFCNFGIGMLVDRENPKRYSYPRRIYINSADTTGKYYRDGQSNNKGELHLRLSLPFFNSFRLTPENEGTKISVGHFGIAIGLDYYHSKNQFINVGISEMTGRVLPIPSRRDIFRKNESTASTFISLSNNHGLKRFTIGYGLSYARNTWEFKYYNYRNCDNSKVPCLERKPDMKKSSAFGLIFPTSFQLMEHFYIGVAYMPTFYKPNMTDKFLYEQLISVDFAWKIKLFDTRKR